MVHGSGEGRASLHVSFEELVCEVLSKEGKHETGALWVWDKLLPEQELLCQHLHIRQLLFSCNRPSMKIKASHINKAKAKQIDAKCFVRHIYPLV